MALRLALAALALGALTGAASATEWVNCADSTGGASFAYLAGASDVLSMAAVTASAGESVWASEVAYGPGDPISVGQAFEDAETVRIDALDGNGARLAQLRLFKADDPTAGPVLAGTLAIVGHGAWAVSCSGP